MKVLKYFIIVLLLLFLSFVAIGFFGYQKYLKTSYNDSDKLVYIEKGSGFIKIATVLEKEKVIKHKNAFILLTRIMNYDKKPFTGEFKFEKNLSIEGVIDKIVNNKVNYRTITFAEGLSTNSIIKILNNEENLVGELNPKDFEEGIYLPETYKYAKGDTKLSILERMKKNMYNLLDEVWKSRDKSVPVKSKFEALILASIVEKETGIPEERGLIASVFSNRLKKRMRLQTDPTVVYSFAFGNTDLERSIRKSDLERKSDFNTYRIYGLPKTPICNPGKESILAVLNPPSSDYLYFVSTGNGGHNFSNNYKDHLKFVNDYRKISSSRK